MRKAEVIEKIRSKYLRGSIEKKVIKNYLGNVRTLKYVWYPRYGPTDGRFKPSFYYILTFAAHDTGSIIVFEDKIDHRTQKILHRREKRFESNEFDDAQIMFVVKIQEWLEAHKKFVSEKLLEHVDSIIKEEKMSQIDIFDETKNNEINHLLRRI